MTNTHDELHKKLGDAMAAGDWKKQQEIEKQLDELEECGN